MADFFPLLDRAVLGLDAPTAENRRVVYARARAVLERRAPGTEAARDGAQGRRQAVAEADAQAESEAELEARQLDDAIARVEAKFAGPTAQALAAEATQGILGPAGDLPMQAASTADAPPPSRRQFAFNAAASGAVSIFKTLLQLAMLPVMARLLGPTAYGVYALAFPTVMFFIMLADGGLGTSLSREDEANRVVWSTAFWTLLGTCGVMAIGVAGSGVVLARVSGQPSLVGIMAFLALPLPLLALSMPADARLMRRGNLLYHSGSDFVGTIVGAAVALVLAFKGAGAWALAAQYVANFAVRAAILNAVAWSPPDFVYDFSSLRGHVSTGGALLVTRLGELGSKLAENALFGHVFGTAQLGSYTLANQVSRFACDAVTNPVVGAFYAQALRESDAEVAALHAKLTRLVMLVLLPATMLMAVAAPDVFPLLLGDKWVEAAPLFQAIVIAYALAGAAWLSGQILLKHGMTDRSAKVILGCGLLRAAGIGTGLWLSPVAVAWLVGASYAVQAVAMTLSVPEGHGSSLGSLVATLWGPAAAAAAAAAVSAGVIALVPGDLASAVGATALGGSLYLALLFAFDGEALRGDVLGLSRVLRRRPA